MQLALPKLRSSSGLKAFNSSLESVEYDLMAWRQKGNMPPRDTAILDADDSAGWELAEALLRPRQIEVDEETGAVKFVNTNHEAIRLSVSLALTHNFMKQVWNSDLSLQQGVYLQQWLASDHFIECGDCHLQFVVSCCLSGVSGEH